MARILVLSLSNLKHDARVMRQVHFLKGKHEVLVCCYDAPPSVEYKSYLLPNIKLSPLNKLVGAICLLLKRFGVAHNIIYPYKTILADLLGKEKLDVIIANDVETLPLAFHIKKAGTKIFFDAHEYAPKHFEDRFWWRVFFQPLNTFLCRKYIPMVDAMMTIGQGLADEYEKNFGKKPVVITNSSFFWDIKPSETTSETIKLVHHGIVNRSRRIELIIGMLDHLPGHFTLDLVLVVPGGSPKQKLYLDELKAFAKGKKVEFLDPVPSSEIVPLLTQFDMGIILAPPINFNYSNGLPNKLFDFIQARLGVVTGPTPEIAKVVNTYQLGVVADDFTSEGLAKKLAHLTRKDVNQFKTQSHLAAKEVAAEKNQVILLDIIDKITA